MPNFNLNFSDSTLKIKMEINELEDKLKEICRAFVSNMPEMQSIVAGNAVANGKSIYNTEDMFWDGISKAGDRNLITLDDYIEYIANNYNEDTINTGEIEDLYNELEENRESVINTCKEAVKEIIKLQEEMIEENKEYIEELKQELIELKQKMDELENEENRLNGEKTLYEGDSNKADKLKEVLAKLDINGREKTRISDKIRELEVGTLNIAELEKKQEEFIINVKKNKKDFIKMLGKYNVKLEDLEIQGQQQQRQQAQQSRSSYVPTQETGVESNVEETALVQQNSINSKKAAKNVLMNLRNSKQPHKLLDDMGYGDIASMIDQLGFFDRRELINIIKNRVKDENAESEKLEKRSLNEIYTEAEYIKAFMSEYSTKTPLEIEEFEEETIKKLKYACLLYDAEQSGIVRRFKQIFSSKHEEINMLKQSVTEYYDTKSKKRREKFNIRNTLRVKVGKKPISKGKPEPIRGNIDGRTQIEQRNIPNGR